MKLTEKKLREMVMGALKESIDTEAVERIINMAQVEGCQIKQGNHGQIVIYTNHKYNTNGQIVPMSDGDGEFDNIWF